MDSAEPPELGPSLILGPMREPAPFLADLRERDPICWIPGLDLWLVTRHDDVRALFSDRRLTTDPRAYAGYHPPTEPGAARALERMPFRAASEGAESLGRRLVSAALTPRATARMEIGIRSLVDEYAAPLHGRRDTIDLMAEFTSPVALTAIGRVAGVPPKGDDEDRFRDLARDATRSIRPFISDKQRRETERASAEIIEYVLERIAERREAPADDLISDLLVASQGDPETSDEDIALVVAGLVAAGTGTSSTAAARALRSLMTNPDQLTLLRGDRSLLPNAIRELLRYDSGLIVMPRYVPKDFDYAGRTFGAGQLVLLSMLGANRDPRVFSRPDELDLTRDTKDSLAFGQGPHYCIGANLALLELRLMIEAALDFVPPNARLVEDEIRWSTRGVMSQINSLPVAFAG